MFLWLCVIVRIVSNPFSNVFQKLLTGRQASPLCVICLTHGLMSLVCLPLLWLYPPPWTLQFWGNMAVGGVLNVAGNVLLVQAVKRADLSVLGPINAYKAVVSLLPGWLLLGEVPGWLGFCGIGLIVVGSYAMVDREPGGKHRGLKGLLADRGVQLRLAALVFSATEAVFMKKALLKSSPLPTFAVWAVLGFVVSLAAVAMLLPRDSYRQQAAVVRSQWHWYWLLACTTGLMQLTTTVTLGGLQVGYTLALFQTSTLLSVLLGYTFFRERHFLRRMAAAAIMVAGAVLIVLGK